MKRLSVFLLVVALACPLALVAQAGGGMEQQVRQVDEAGRAAAERNDPTWLEQNLTDNFVMTNAQGMKTDRSGAIGMRRSGQLKYTSVKTDEWTCQVYNGDTAIVNATADVSGTYNGHDVSGRYRNTRVVNATADVSGTYNGHDVSGRYRNTRVWVKQGGKWKLAAFQSSRVAQ